MMGWTLKSKLLWTTITTVVTIGMLGLNASLCAGIFSEKLDQSSVITSALRNHTNADMMHDALRADVFSAFYAASKSPERRQQIGAATREHAELFDAFIINNYKLPLPEGLRQELSQLEKSLRIYSAAAEDLVAKTFENSAVIEDQLAEFEKQFFTLEVEMKAVGDSIENYAKSEVANAESFAGWARLLSQVGLVIGLLISAFAVRVMRHDVLEPLSHMTAAMEKLAGGNLDAAVSDTLVSSATANDELGDMARSVEVFRQNAISRNRLTRESRVLSELNEWLQSAKSEVELYQMIATFLSRLLPDCTGSLYIYANSRDILECVQVWNGTQGTETMHPDDCWGLRRGRTYTHGQHEIEFDCAHVHSGAGEDYCCIPILAHGETVGLLHMEFVPGADCNSAGRKAVFAEERRLGLAAAEHISLAIANVKLREQLRDQAIRDVLTGLYNRRYMLETCRREFQRAARAGEPVSVLSIDVDHFKTFNDNHGHDAGDSVLRCVGEALSTSFRDEDVACRFGGEEFVVLLPRAEPAVAARRAEALRAKIEALTVRYAEKNLPKVTISVGVASFPHSGGAPMEVLKVADEALYMAKREGRNCVRLSPGCKDKVADETASKPPETSDENPAELGHLAAAHCCGETRGIPLLEAAE